MLKKKVKSTLDARRLNRRSYDREANGGFPRGDAAIVGDHLRSATMFDVINKGSDGDNDDVYGTEANVRTLARKRASCDVLANV